MRFVFEYIQSMVDIKTDRLLKLQEDVVSMGKIIEFFENQDELLMVVIMTFGGTIEVYNSFPAVMKNKGYYFVKNSKVSYEANSELSQMKNSITYGDLHKSPIHHFIAFVNTVSYPLSINFKRFSPRLFLMRKTVKNGQSHLMSISRGIYTTCKRSQNSF